MTYTIVKSQTIPRLWLVKNSEGNIVKYAYSEKEAQDWVKERT